MRKLRLLLVVLAPLLAGFTGCALRQPRGSYRLSEINSQYFLLSPDAVSSQEDHQTLRIPRQKGTPLNKDCSIKGPWFSFYPVQRERPYWIVETPAAAAWERSSGAIDMKDQWQGFARGLYTLDQRQCFASGDEYRATKQRIAASLSAPALDTLFYRYAYGPGGYVDLAPGMQLRIERDFFSMGGSGQPRPTDYQGTTITNYEISGTADSGVALKFLRVEKRSAKPAIPDLSSTDTSLAPQFGVVLHLRLFLLNLVVSDNAKAPAILIGAATNEQLNDATQAIESDPGINCSSFLRSRVTCALFDGLVTVSPMLKVIVNGKSTNVPIGSRLSLIIPPVANSQKQSPIRKLRLERSFQGKPTVVQFAPNQEEVSQLLLFDGDRVSWSETTASRKVN